jgi:hypothetical protein
MEGGTLMMKHPFPWLGSVAFTALAVLVAACATIVSGGTQKIRVSSSPTGASVTAEPGGYRITAPGEMALKRNATGYKLKFEKEGHQPVEVELTVGLNGWVWGNIVIGGVIGILIDFSSGAYYELQPGVVDAHLPLQVTGRQPRDSMVVFDAEGTHLVTIRFEDS